MNRKKFIGSLALAPAALASASELKSADFKFPNSDPIGRPIKRRDIRDLINEHRGRIRIDFFFEDSQYSLVKKEWFVDMVDWWKSFKDHFGLVSKENAFDCDDFSRSFLTFSSLASFKHNFSRSKLAIGTIYVKQKIAWGGISQGRNHALIIFFSDRQAYVLEPITGVVGEFRNYPNRGNVYSLKI